MDEESGRSKSRPSFFARFTKSSSKNKIVPESSSEIEMTRLTSHLSRLEESKQSMTQNIKQESIEVEDDISQLSKVSLTHKYDDVKKTLTILDPSMDYTALFFELLRTRFLIFPKSPQKLLWDVLMAIVIMYVVVFLLFSSHEHYHTLICILEHQHRYSLVAIPMGLAEFTPPDDSANKIVDTVVDILFWIEKKKKKQATDTTRVSMRGVFLEFLDPLCTNFIF